MSIFTNGKWTTISDSFESVDALRSAARLLSAGRVPIDEDDAVARRFYTEEGWTVHVAAGLDNPFILVDKTPAFDGPEIFGEADIHIIRESIASGARILVVGRTPSARRAVFFRILSLLPGTAFVAAVGEIGTASPLAVPQQVVIDLAGDFNITIEDARSALSTAVSMNPDWLGITGLVPAAIQEILAAAATRNSVVAEVPLSGTGILSRELAVALGTGGLSVTPAQAAVFLTESFDLVVAADCVREEIVYIKSVFSTAVTEKGSWAPHILYSRDITA